jgi:hypothetical protein
MHLPAKRALSVGAVVVALGGLTATGAHAAHADTLADCHASAYEVHDGLGNPVEISRAIINAKTGAVMGILYVELYYCIDYQSNFARAQFYSAAGPGGVPSYTVKLFTVGASTKVSTSAVHTLNSGATNTDGSQDSPAYYAPVEPVYACFADATFISNDTGCTEAV